MNGRIAALWQQNADKVQLLYNTACYYAAVYDLRRMAAVKGQHFFCVGWVPASEVDEVAGKARAVKGLRVFLRGANLCTISGIKDVDPENINSGVTEYPLYRTFTAGFKLSF